MRFEELERKAIELVVGGSIELYRLSNGITLSLRRPKKVGSGLKRSYDVEKNLQIWHKDKDGKEFMPNHLRILIDLYFKQLERNDLRRDFYHLFDRIFYGEDPREAVKGTENIIFKETRMPLEYPMYLEQLFMVEQTVGYSHESQFDPKYLFLHGWVRVAISGENEIDKLLWSATRSPPPVRFTCQDNKKHKRFNPRKKQLWYLDNEV